MNSKDYFEVTFANGQIVVAYDVPESYVKQCLENTDSLINTITEERAEQINHYYTLNSSAGWYLLRIHALEAKIWKLENK